MIDALPARDEVVAEAEAIPAGLIHQLLAHRVPEAEIRTTTAAEAIQRMSDI